MTVQRASGGVPVASALQLIAVGRGLNFQLITDQPLTRVFSGLLYMPTYIVAKRATGAATVACAGGIYDAAAKAGNAMVAAAQVWLALAANVCVPAVVIQTFQLSATPILSLTTGSTGAVTADVFVYGFSLD